MYEFKLPDLGEGIHEGEILKWYVEPGKAIKEDEPLIDIETDKAAVTIPSPKGGNVVSQEGKVGDTVFVGNVIAVIDANGSGTAAPAARKEETGVQAEAKADAAQEEKVSAIAKAGSDASEAAKSPGSAKTAAHARPALESASPAGAAPSAPARPAADRKSGPVPAAPATRRLARELGVDIRLVPPSGPAGRVTSDDVKRFAEGGASASVTGAEAAGAETAGGGDAGAGAGDVYDAAADKAAVAEFAAHAASTVPFLDIEPLPDFAQWGPVETEPLRSIRRKVAHKMVTSMTLVPHVAHMDDADVTLLEDFRKREKERRKGGPGESLTLLAFVVKAVTAGLKAAPAFNASLDPFKEQIIYKKYVHVGIAVDTGRGLVVPVIRDTDRKSIIRIANDIHDVATRAREGKIDVSELRGGTFTITNVGPLGGTALIPTINYPEVAILGMGKVQEKPVVRDGQIVIRKILPLTLAFDHRIADGADAARFVSELVRQLSDPNLLLLEA